MISMNWSLLAQNDAPNSPRRSRHQRGADIPPAESSGILPREPRERMPREPAGWCPVLLGCSKITSRFGGSAAWPECKARGGASPWGCDRRDAPDPPPPVKLGRYWLRLRCPRSESESYPPSSRLATNTPPAKPEVVFCGAQPGDGALRRPAPVSGATLTFRGGLAAFRPLPRRREHRRRVPNPNRVPPSFRVSCDR